MLLVGQALKMDCDDIFRGTSPSGHVYCYSLARQEAFRLVPPKLSARLPLNGSLSIVANDEQAHKYRLRGRHLLTHTHYPVSCPTLKATWYGFFSFPFHSFHFLLIPSHVC